MRRIRKLEAAPTHICQLDLIQRTAFVVDWDSFHSIEGGVGAIDDLAEDGVLAV